MHGCGSLLPQAVRRREVQARRSTSTISASGEAESSEAEAREICAMCSHATPDGCALINENMLARVRASKGCGGCGGKAAHHYDPKRYYELVLRGAPHPERMRCPLMAR